MIVFDRLCRYVKCLDNFSSVLNLKTCSRCKSSSTSSHRWKIRQNKDEYVELAREQGFRCRSAFKLLEINDKFRLIRPENLVLDIGAAPGAWSQVASDIVFRNSEERIFQAGVRGVIAVDLLNIDLLSGVHILSGCDILSESTHSKISQLLIDKKCDVILSDMAPNASGIASLDSENLFNMNSTVYNKIAVKYLAKGGSLAFKFWQTPDLKDFSNLLKEKFKLIKTFKPKSSRKESSEVYLIAKSFI
ncbi:ribosomal RNA large subunit methyltransferase E-like [Convolutriloba macropyga]|uniref:ribosomal RNA large subunit methyltransferase E-like n=1 Tax=Convolutriloba macropyga TaxID=536237 RepID=UPI003F51C2B7